MHHTLSRNESIALLRNYLAERWPKTAATEPAPDATNAPDVEPALDAIAEALGDLPLALHLAGHLLKLLADVTPADYLANLRTTNLLQHSAFQSVDLTPSPSNHALHLACAFALNYDQLNPTDPGDALALAFLARAACFAPGEPIPRDLLRATLAPAEMTSRIGHCTKLPSSG